MVAMSPRGAGGAAAPPSYNALHLPSLSGVSPDLLPAEAAAQAMALTPRAAAGMITTRQQRRPTPRHVKKAIRQLWKAEVKRWCEVSGKHIDWGFDRRDEAELTEWFNTLDVNRSGTVEEFEVRALMTTLGLEAGPARLARMYAAVGKTVDAPLNKLGARPARAAPPPPSPPPPPALVSCTRPRAPRPPRRLPAVAEFVRFMAANAEVFSGAAPHSPAEDHQTSSLFDPDTRLMMMQYRRQRLLDDVGDPAKRRNFLSYQSFNEAYGQTLGMDTTRAPPTPRAPPHPMSQLPKVSPRPMPPASARAPGSMLAPRPRRVGDPAAGFDGDGVALPRNLKHTRGGGGVAAAAALPAIAPTAMPTWDDRPAAETPRGGTSLAQAAPT